MHGVGKNPADGSQPSYENIKSAHSFGGEPQFDTRSLLRKQSEFHQNPENSQAFVG